MEKLTPDNKTAPIVAGQQGRTDNVVHLGANRRDRRAAEVAKQKQLQKLPGSIWTITDVITGPSELTGTRLFEIWIWRRGDPDMLMIYSREGAAPQIGGLLERMTGPKGGVAAIWTDAGATKESMGGGYSEAALPPEWGTPAVKVGMTEKQRAMFGMPTANDLKGHQQLPEGDRS